MSVGVSEAAKNDAPKTIPTLQSDSNCRLVTRAGFVTTCMADPTGERVRYIRNNILTSVRLGPRSKSCAARREAGAGHSPGARWAEIFVTILTGFGLGHLLQYGRELSAMDQVIGAPSGCGCPL